MNFVTIHVKLLRTQQRHVHKFSTRMSSYEKERLVFSTDNEFLVIFHYREFY